MPRKNSSKLLKDIDMTPQLMPFQTSKDKMNLQGWGFNSVGKLSSGADIAKAALPIFGGTQPTETESSSDESSDESKKSTKTESNTTSSGGDSATSTEALSPEQIADLMAQVTQLNSTVTQLKTENDSFKSKEDEQRRASQGREQTLEEDNTRLAETVQKMDKVIKHLAIVNAIQGNRDIQFHNPRDVIARLDHSAYNLDVDLENGQATVKNIENELKRIAREEDYLVVKPLDNGPSTRAPRSSGAPSGPANTNSTAKAQRRKELEAKWPIIAKASARMS